MERDAEDANPPRRLLDHGKHIGRGAVEQVGCEEVARQDRLGLGAQELRPGRPGAPRRGVDPGILQDLFPCPDRAAQRRRTMSRCQRRTVSGVTSRRSPRRRALGIRLRTAAIRARSAQFRCRRLGWRRCRTASWWRRIKISAVFYVSSRRHSRGHAARRVIRRNANRRHMIGDHHCQMAAGATLLLRASDGVLGTHRISASLFSGRSGEFRAAGQSHLPKVPSGAVPQSGRL